MEPDPERLPPVTIQSTNGAPGLIAQVANKSTQDEGLPLMISDASVVSVNTQVFPTQILDGGSTYNSGSGGRLISIGSTVAELEPQGFDAEICTSKALI